MRLQAHVWQTGWKIRHRRAKRGMIDDRCWPVVLQDMNLMWKQEVMPKWSTPGMKR